MHGKKKKKQTNKQIGAVGRTGEGRGRLVVCKVMKGRLSNKVTFELRPEGGEEMCSVNVSVTTSCQVVTSPKLHIRFRLLTLPPFDSMLGCLIDVSNLRCLKLLFFAPRSALPIVFFISFVAETRNLRLFEE